MRLIDADALITYCDEHWIPTNVNAINAQPTIEPMRWIPCSERLPEHGTIALACGKNGGVRIARVFIPYATGNWNGDPNTNWWTIVGTGKTFFPVAWMPLPEPYEERRGE